MRTIRNILLLSLALDLIAFIFCFTEERGVHGYATVLIYTALGAIILPGLFVMGATGPRRAHDELLHLSIPDEDGRRIERADRERGLSVGLILFSVALLSGICGYFLADFTHP